MDEDPLRLFRQSLVKWKVLLQIVGVLLREDVGRNIRSCLQVEVDKQVTEYTNNQYCNSPK